MLENRLVGDDCVLGVSVALGIDTPNLTAACQHFKEEARQLDPEYQPEIVNTDGWKATQKAWRSLFPLIILLECFLHAFIKIRERGKHLKETFQQLSQKIWKVYHTSDAAAFRSQAAELLTWAESNTTGCGARTLFKGRPLCSGLRPSFGPANPPG